jgi:hypothetical protein
MERLTPDINDTKGNDKEIKFELLLQDIRNEVANNGLTEEILAQLLNDQD